MILPTGRERLLPVSRPIAVLPHVIGAFIFQLDPFSRRPWR